MPTRLSASGRASSPPPRVGSGSGSVFALRIFCAMVSASSVRLMREWSDGIRLRHLLGAVAQRHHARRRPLDQRLGQREERVAEAVRAIDSAKSLLNFCAMSRAELEMLLLVLADRHMRRAIDQDVGRHQARIGVKPDRGVLAVLAGLLLELGHAVEPAEAGDAVEHPGELGVLGDLALVEDDVLLRIDAAGDERGGHLARRSARSSSGPPHTDRHRDGVQVDDAIDAVVAAPAARRIS